VTAQLKAGRTHDNGFSFYTTPCLRNFTKITTGTSQSSYNGFSLCTFACLAERILYGQVVSI
jgi:hypothetical protein